VALGQVFIPPNSPSSQSPGAEVTDVPSGPSLGPHYASGSLVDRVTMLQVGRSRTRFPMRSLDFSIDLILPSVL
jgi:hypothetical protein